MTDAASSDGITSASGVWRSRRYRVDDETARRELKRAAATVMVFLGLLTVAAVALVRSTGTAASLNDSETTVRPTPERAL